MNSYTPPEQLALIDKWKMPYRDAEGALQFTSDYYCRYDLCSFIDSSWSTYPESVYPLYRATDLTKYSTMPYEFALQAYIGAVWSQYFGKDVDAVDAILTRMSTGGYTMEIVRQGVA